jgi:integrase
MPRKVHEKLTARAVATIKAPGYHIDGEGLYLQVLKSGAKSWVFRYMLNGRAREMGLGSAGTFSLAQARAMATAQRALLQEKTDPIDARNSRAASEAADSTKVKTFKECAEAYIKAHRGGWKNRKHVAQWENTLRDYAYHWPADAGKAEGERRPLLRDLLVSQIDTALVLQTLEPIWNSKPETASRLRGRIENILDWARVRGFRDGENPARWRGHLDKLLPRRSKVAMVKHHPALPYAAMGGFMVELRAQEGMAARALEFIILTAARTSEAIGATWDEIDLDNGVWTIPAARMKARRPHRVPLAAPAVALLRTLKAQRLNDFVFAGMKKDKPLSNMACLTLLERMGKTSITVHGFRSTFRDWAYEQTSFPREIVEAALAHTLKDKAEAAYRRGEALEKRAALMGAWANFCATTKSGEVHPIQKAASRRAAA